VEIKSKLPSNGKGGAHSSHANGTNGSASAARAIGYERRTRASRILLGRFTASVGEVWEGALQILNGVTPYVPSVRIRETSDSVVVNVALPGIDTDSLNITFEGRFLRVSATKTKIREWRHRKYRRVVKTYRTFERTIPMFDGFDIGRAVATLYKEVLRIRVPRTEWPRHSAKAMCIAPESAQTVS